MNLELAKVLEIVRDLEVLVNLCFAYVLELASNLKLKLLLLFKLGFKLFADLELAPDLDLAVTGAISWLKATMFMLVKIALAVLRPSWSVFRAVSTDATEAARITGQVFVVDLVLVHASDGALIL